MSHLFKLLAGCDVLTFICHVFFALLNDSVTNIITNTIIILTKKANVKCTFNSILCTIFYITIFYAIKYM